MCWIHVAYLSLQTLLNCATLRSRILLRQVYRMILVCTSLKWDIMQVDGFRWDIMGHLMLRNMTKVVEAVKQLSFEKDGVDGSKIQQYAEAWSFGEVIISGNLLYCLLRFERSSPHCWLSLYVQLEHRLLRLLRAKIKQALTVCICNKTPLVIVKPGLPCTLA